MAPDFFGSWRDRRRKYVRKGSQICRGRLQTRKWQDKDGRIATSTEIVADRMQMLGGRPNGNDPTPAAEANPKPAKSAEQVRSAGKRYPVLRAT